MDTRLAKLDWDEMRAIGAEFFLERNLEPETCIEAFRSGWASAQRGKAGKDRKAVQAERAAALAARAPRPERTMTGLDDWFDEKVMVDFENQEPLAVSEVVNSANAYLAEKGLRQVSSRAVGVFLSSRGIVSKVTSRAGKSVRHYLGVWAVLY
jgi:hypothetical protein